MREDKLNWSHVKPFKTVVLAYISNRVGYRKVKILGGKCVTNVRDEVENETPFGQRYAVDIWGGWILLKWEKSLCREREREF